MIEKTFAELADIFPLEWNLDGLELKSRLGGSNQFLSMEVEYLKLAYFTAGIIIGKEAASKEIKEVLRLINKQLRKEKHGKN